MGETKRLYQYSIAFDSHHHFVSIWVCPLWSAKCIIRTHAGACILESSTSTWIRYLNFQCTSNGSVDISLYFLSFHSLYLGSCGNFWGKITTNYFNEWALMNRTPTHALVAFNYITFHWISNFWPIRLFWPLQTCTNWNYLKFVRYENDFMPHKTIISVVVLMRMKPKRISSLAENTEMWTAHGFWFWKYFKIEGSFACKIFFPSFRTHPLAHHNCRTMTLFSVLFPFRSHLRKCDKMQIAIVRSVKWPLRLCRTKVHTHTHTESFKCDCNPEENETNKSQRSSRKLLHFKMAVGETNKRKICECKSLKDLFNLSWVSRLCLAKNVRPTKVPPKNLT